MFQGLWYGDLLWKIDIDGDGYEGEYDDEDGDFLRKSKFTSMIKRNLTKFIEVY